jgi:hypothetical protein
MKLALLFLVFLMAWSPLFAESDEVKIRAQGIAQPLNRVLLIQREDYLGAVVFVSYEKNEQGEFTRYRSYKHSPEGWREENGGTIGMKSLTWGQRVLGKLGFHTPPLARVKPLELKGLTLLANPSSDGRHAIVYYGLSSTHPDPKIKLAPTPWRTIQEVDLKDARLKWYSSGGPEQKAKIDELWK